MKRILDYRNLLVVLYVLLGSLGVQVGFNGALQSLELLQDDVDVELDEEDDTLDESEESVQASKSRLSKDLHPYKASPSFRVIAICSLIEQQYCQHCTVVWYQKLPKLYLFASDSSPPLA